MSKELNRKIYDTVAELIQGENFSESFENALLDTFDERAKLAIDEQVQLLQTSFITEKLEVAKTVLKSLEDIRIKTEMLNDIQQSTPFTETSFTL